MNNTTKPQDFNSIDITQGTKKSSKDYGSNSEQNISKNHSPAQSDNQNTQKLQQNATDLANHSEGIKAEDEYAKGGHGTIGEAARRSRREAEEFQKNSR